MSEEDIVKTVEALMKDQRWTEAIAASESALAEAEPSDELLGNVGKAHFYLEQYEQAIPYLRKAIEHGPVRDDYYAFLGTAHRELKNYFKAEMWLLRALAMRDRALTRLSLALVYMEQDLGKAAEAVHREGIRLKPNSRERLEAYADFLSDLGREEEAKEMYEEAKKKGEG